MHGDSMLHCLASNMAIWGIDNSNSEEIHRPQLFWKNMCVSSMTNIESSYDVSSTLKTLIFFFFFSSNRTFILMIEMFLNTLFY